MKPFLPTLRGSATPLLGSAITLNSPYAAQILARSGFDFLMIDMEHSPCSALETTHTVHAIVAASAGACIPLVRVPSHGVEWIKWALDAGAAGIIVPMVNSAAEAAAVVRSAVYPPGGQRSSGPFRTVFAEVGDPAAATVEQYRRVSAPEVAVLVMIESVEGLADAEAIVATAGVDGVFIGPVDLRSSMGLEGADGEEVEYVAGLSRILAIGKRLGKPVGILGAEGAALARQVSLGFDYFLLAGDWVFLAKGAAMTLDAARRSVGEPGKS